MSRDPFTGHFFQFYDMNRWLVLIFSVFLLSACEKGGENEPVPEPRLAERTVMVWLAGDNNLYPEVPRKLSALAEGFRHSAEAGCRLLVYADYRGSHPQLVEMMPDGNRTVLETYPVRNSASPETLARSLRHMTELAPAECYGLIVFSHATGWLPQGALEDPYLTNEADTRTVLDDEGFQMPLEDFAAALPDDILFDYIVFENCFMGELKWLMP